MRHLRLLIAKDARELVASRAFWLLLLVVGMLVGHAFMTAASTYAELSGAAGGTPVLAQGLNPLDGIVRPIFGAYTVAATLLLPFVAIRLIANERQSGAARLLLQAPVSRAQVVLSKVIVLKLAWIAALIPGFLALAQWRFAGGHLYWPEVISVLIGHVAIAVITIGVALAAGAIAGSPASAAIIALTFTLGTWAIEFAATVQGGWIAQLARYTPSALLRTFENGEIRLASIVIASLIALLGAWIAVIAMDLGAPLNRRIAKPFIVTAIVGTLAGVFSTVRASADVSEDRRTSFSEVHERALRSIGEPLRLEANLGPEDPRRIDLEREILAKLQRVMNVRVDYVGESSTGLTSRSEHYGEMVYSLGGRSDTTRSVIEPIVLELIYDLAGVKAPSESTEESVYPGYPLQNQPAGIVFVFFVIWPVLVFAAWAAARRLF
jgi:ABC-type transport system involved in multi-copper enzyme maturation permease subunit